MKCPHCAETIKVDAKKCKHCAEWVTDSKTCHQCAEVVREEALKCKHCGEKLPGKKNGAASTNSRTGAVENLSDIAVASHQFSDSLPDAPNQLRTVQQCIGICREYFGGTEPSREAVKEFVDAVARVRQWKGKTADTRKSEVRTLVSQYHRLSTVCEAVVADSRSERFTWHDAIRVARLCKNQKIDKRVVAEFYKKKAK